MKNLRTGKIIFALAFLTLISFCCVGECGAQVISGAVEGVVRDPQGALIPGAEVTVTQIGTGQSRTLMTNEEGFFKADQLQIGEYKITVTKEGYKQVSTTADVKLGAPATVLLELPVGSVSETVTVGTGEAPVELSTGELSRSIGSREIDALPVLSRNTAELLQLFPGVPVITEDKNGSLTVGGLRPRSTTYNVDGSSNNFDVQSGPRTPIIREAIQETRAVTNVFSAQYGKGSGAVIDQVLKSGTNQFRGSLFEYYRNSALDANNFFNNSRGLSKPQFLSNIYGLTVGGPIVKDKTFFFTAFQGTNQRTSQLEVLTLPSNSVRTPLTTPVGGITSLATDPAVANVITQIFATLPSCAEGNRTCRYTSNQALPSDEYIFSTKIDHHFNENNVLSGRGLYRTFKSERNSAISVANQTFTNKDSNFALTYRRVFSSKLVNEAVVSYSHFRRSIDVGATLPDVNISGFAFFGAGSNFPQQFTNKYVQFLDNLSIIKGNHTFRTGVEFLRSILTGFAMINVRGVYAFAPQPAGVGTSDPLTNFRLGRGTSYTRSQGDFVREFATNDFSLYFQDDWKVRPNLTLNLGVRYDVQFAPKIKTVADGLKAFAAFDPTAFRYTDYQTDLDNISPVFGFAWDPFKKGKTALRGGYRIAYDRMVADFYNLGSTVQAPFIETVAVALPQVTAIPFGNADAIARAQGIPVTLLLRPDTKLSFAHSYQLSIQQELFKDFTLEVGYIGTAGRSLPQQIAVNRIDPATRSRPNPAFGQIILVDDTAYSNYNALTTLARYRFSRLTFTAAYTFSKALDITHDAVATFGGQASTVSVAADAATGAPRNDLEYGPAIFDRPHAFSSSVVYRTPNITRNRWAGALLNDWRVAAILFLQSGNPFPVIAGADLNQDGVNNDRPDLVDASLLQGVYADPDVLIPRAAFNGALTTAPRIGNFGRNVLRRDAVNEVSLSLVKRFSFSERYSMEFRSEFFNVFNKPRFNPPVFTVAAGNFGQITSQANSPRNVRFGLTFNF
jgi:hypothetical protein